MSAEYTVSHYLIDRLKEFDIRHVFGVPGDYAFPFLDRLCADEEMTWVGSCNENNAGLAADGYARIHGIAAQVYTCGPGQLGAAGALGGSFDEQVPVITISGHPPLHMNPKYVMTHHSLNGNFSHYDTIFAQLSAGHAELGEDDPRGQIDEVLAAAWSQRRPGWITIPKDVQTLAVEPPAGKLDLPEAASDPKQLDEFMTELLSCLAKAERPAILADFPVQRYGLTPTVERLAEKSGIPVAITFGARAAFFDEGAPDFIGTYFAPSEGDPLSDRISQADLLLRLAVQPTEVNMGCAHPSWTSDAVVDVQIQGATIGDRKYPKVAMADVLFQLGESVPHRNITGLPPDVSKPVAAPFIPQGNTAITQNRLLDGIAALLREGDVLISDQGTSSGVTGVPKPARVKTIVQNAWGAIGYATPAVLGALVADPGSRHVVVTGDGGFQEVAQELSTIMRHEYAPIFVLFNNAHYVVENLVGGTDVQDNIYNVINSWDYHKLPAVLAPDSGAVGLRVTTEDEWAEAAKTAEKAQSEGKFVLIEVMLAADDVSDIYRFQNSPTVGSR